jgi:hypothetical protein
MHRMKDYVEEERKKRPEVWGRGGYEEIPYTSMFGFTGLNKVKVPIAETETFVTARYFPNADRDEHMIHYLYDHLLKVSVAVVIGCMLLLHPLYGLAVGAMLAIINFQVLGIFSTGINYNLIYNPFRMEWMGAIEYVDMIAFGVMVMAIGFEIEYVVHIAHAFLHCEGDGFVRARNALEEMGITVASAALSTAVQQLVLLFFAQSLAFSIFPKVLIVVIVKAGITGFIFAPGVLGVIHSYLVSKGKIESQAVKDQREAEKAKMGKLAAPAAAEENVDATDV